MSPICTGADIVPNMSKKCPVTEEARVNDLQIGWVVNDGIDLRHSSEIRERPDPVSTKACTSVAAKVS